MRYRPTVALLFFATFMPACRQRDRLEQFAEQYDKRAKVEVNGEFASGHLDEYRFCRSNLISAAG